MKTVILHGGRSGEAGPEAACALLSEALQRDGTTVKTLRLAELSIGPCTGCFGCWLRTPGECLQDDDGREVARSLVQADVRVFLSAVTFGGYSGVLKTALDRLIPTISPLFTTVKGEMRHRLRYPGKPVIIGVGWQEQPDPEAAALFCRLVERNSLNMHARAVEALVLDGTQTPAEQRALIEGLVARLEGAST